MRPNIEFAECLRDSPRFRASLEDNENDIDRLEEKLEKLVKLCGTMIDAGKAFNNANSAFINGLQDVSVYFQDDELVPVALQRFTRVLTEVQKFNHILLDQANRSVCKNLNAFIKNDIRKVKDMRKHFEKISGDMDESLVRNASVARSKSLEGDEAANVLTAMRSCFGHIALDYVFQINILHSKKRFDVLDTMLAYMHAQSTFFHQGYDLYSDLEPYTKQLEQLNSKATLERKEMEDRHTLVQKQQDISLDTLSSNLMPVDVPTDNDCEMGGYLFKRTTNAFKTWVRRWFSIQNHQLVYRKRSKDCLTIMEEDLRLCTVRPFPDIDRRFCFEVLSPSRTHMLQADTEKEYRMWVNCIQQGVAIAYNLQNPIPVQDDSWSDTKSEGSVETNQSDAAHGQSEVPASSTQNRMQQIMSMPGNEVCCDCGSPDPAWASVNLGVTICIECCGIHRSFGVHVSKVRSLTLDAWEHAQLKVMAELGNVAVNGVYEADAAAAAAATAARATPKCSREVREAWLQAKYMEKAFVRRLPVPPGDGKTGGAGARSAGEGGAKTWSVMKWKRCSANPTASSSSGQSPASLAGREGTDGTSIAEETPTSVGGEPIASGVDPSGDPSSDPSGDPNKRSLAEGESRLGGGSPDVLVFGAVSCPAAIVDSRCAEDDDSTSETELDARSTTSLEDVASLAPSALLYRAAQARHLVVMLEALALGADVNWHRPAPAGGGVGGAEGKSGGGGAGETALIKAVQSGSMAPVEFLLLNGAKVDTRDCQGRSALHHATILGHTGQVCQLLKRNANQLAVDESGKDPLAIAVDAANADIVTILRLSKLNEEMKETEGVYGMQGDETFNEVFRDFTNMAYNSPEKLNRNK